MDGVFALMGLFIKSSETPLTLKAKLARLADIVQLYENIKQDTDIVFVLSLDDPATATTIAEKFMIFRKKIPRAIFATSPFRLQYCTQMCRDDLMTKFCIHFPQTGRLEDHVNREYENIGQEVCAEFGLARNIQQTLHTRCHRIRFFARAFSSVESFSAALASLTTVPHFFWSSHFSGSMWIPVQRVTRNITIRSPYCVSDKTGISTFKSISNSIFHIFSG